MKTLKLTVWDSIDYMHEAGANNTDLVFIPESEASFKFRWVLFNVPNAAKRQCFQISDFLWEFFDLYISPSNR